jgi:hypothetical protein
VTKDRAKQITVSGGTFTNSAIGIGRIEQHNTAGTQQVTVSDLRTALREHADEIVALGRDDAERESLRAKVSDLESETAEAEPDGDIVRGTWKSVLKVLEGAAAAATSVGTITDLVGTLFGS